MKQSIPLALALLFAGVPAVLLAGCGEGDLPPSQTVDQGLASGSATATLSFQSDWGGGYCANVTVSNGGTAALTGWQVVINLNQSTLSQSWNTTMTTSGTQVTLTSLAWNASVAPGASTTVGFCGSATGTNYHPTLTSVSVSGGGGPGGGSIGTGGSTGGAGGAIGTGGAMTGTGGKVTGTGGAMTGTGGKATGTGGAMTGTGGKVTGTGGAMTGTGGKLAGTGGSTGTGGTTGACTAGNPWTGGTQHSSNSQGNVATATLINCGRTELGPDP